jgi:hypothetical protein
MFDAPCGVNDAMSSTMWGMISHPTNTPAANSGTAALTNPMV